MIGDRLLVGLDMRNYLLASLGGHLLLIVVGSLMSLAVYTSVEPANLIRVNLVNLPDLTREKPKPTPPPEIPPETPPEPVEETVIVPPVPETIVDRPPLLEADDGASEPPEQTRELELAPPDADLPPAPDPVKPRPEDDLEFMEPEDVAPPVAAAAPEEDLDLPAAEEASSAATDAGGGIQVESPDGIPDYYLALIKRKIDRRWEPSAARTRGGTEVACVIRFRISRAGQILEPRIIQTSGLSVFDREALRAITDSSPLPPPPAKSTAAEVPISIRFNLDR